MEVIGTILRVGWRALRATALALYITIMALSWGYWIIKYVCGKNERKNLRVINNTAKSIKKAVKALRK